MANKVHPDRLTKALLETADDVRRSGVIGAAAHDKITMRHLGSVAVPAVEPMTGDDIRRIRERAHLSQAVFARYLKLTVGYVSQRAARSGRPAPPSCC